MASFDFITDDELRDALNADFNEMAADMQVGSYTSAQVLAGSIVEALLVDHLISSAYTPPGKKDILELSLGELLAAAKTLGVINQTTVDLASVVKDYRNLIHPGRAKRLKERATEHTARIAMDLVEIITSGVAASKQTSYGLTAAQIVAKVQSDPTAASIIGDLLRDAPAPEIERLLLKALPERYLEHSSSDDSELEPILKAFRRTYHAAMDAGNDDLRKKVTERYVRVVKEQPEFEVLQFEAAFFRPSDLRLLSPADAQMLKAHLVDQVVTNFGPRLEHALSGFGSVATEGELGKVAAAILSWVVANDTSERRRSAEPILRALWVRAPSDIRSVVPAAAAFWHRGTGPENWMKWLAGLRRSMGDDPAPNLGFDETEIDELPF